MYRVNHPNHPGMHNQLYYDGYEYSRFESRKSQHHQIKYNVVTSLAGIAVIIAALGVIYWNEGITLASTILVEEKIRLVRELTFTGVSLEDNNNKLVHLTGKLMTDQPLKDAEFGVSIHAVHLKKRVEMYQWVESEMQTKDSDFTGYSNHRMETSYAYDMEWRDSLISSEKFVIKIGHENPKSFPGIKSDSVTIPKCYLGQFVLSKSLMEKINNYKPIDDLQSSNNPKIKLHNRKYYKQSNPKGDVLRPEIGDIRVEFFYAGKSGINADTVSVIAKQDGLNLIPYEAVDGKNIEMLYFGQLPPQDILAIEENHDHFLTWCIRFCGWFLVFFGVSLLSSLNRVLIRKVSIIRSISYCGRYAVRISFTNFLVFSTIIIHWYYLKPIICSILLLIATFPFAFMILRRHCKYSASHWNV